jgi:hypothetical protein
MNHYSCILLFSSVGFRPTSSIGFLGPVYDLSTSHVLLRVHLSLKIDYIYVMCLYSNNTKKALKLINLASAH